MGATLSHCGGYSFSLWGLLSLWGFSRFGASLIVGLLSLWGLLIVDRGSRSSTSAILVRGLSRPIAYGIFPDQGVNPCPLHWQVDSYSLNPPGKSQSDSEKVLSSFVAETLCSLGTDTVPDPVLEAGSAARGIRQVRSQFSRGLPENGRR